MLYFRLYCYNVTFFKCNCDSLYKTVCEGAFLVKLLLYLVAVFQDKVYRDTAVGLARLHALKAGQQRQGKGGR